MYNRERDWIYVYQANNLGAITTTRRTAQPPPPGPPPAGSKTASGNCVELMSIPEDSRVVEIADCSPDQYEMHAEYVIWLKGRQCFMV